MTKDTPTEIGIRVRPALVYGLFLLGGIPWYWPSDNHLIVLGMPAWVVVATAVSFCASVYTALLLRRPWPGERPIDQKTHDAANDPSQ